MREGLYGCQPSINTATGEVTFNGIDFEGRKLFVHEKTDDTLVIKVNSGSSWNGRGYTRRYVPAQFIVMIKPQILTNSNGLWWTVAEFPIRKEK